MRFVASNRLGAFAGLSCSLMFGTLVQAGNPAGRALRTVYGPTDQVGLGSFVAAAGDVDNDGTPDYAVTLLRGGGLVGTVNVYSGASGSLIRTLYSHGFVNMFGMSMANAGDLNNDGHSDLLVGSPLEFDIDITTEPPTFFGMHCSVEGYSGLTGNRMFRLLSQQDDDGQGWSVASAGDVNGDGVPDLLAGAPFWNGTGQDHGRAVVYSGADRSILHEVFGTAAHGEYGFCVAGAGDLNNDNHSDVLIGVPSSSKAIAYDAYFEQVIHSWNIGAMPTFYGGSVASVSDLTGDGVNETVVGGKNAAKATLYNGATGAVLHTFTGPAGSQFGYCVADAGDANGDGVHDIAISAPRFPRGYTRPGRVFVYDGVKFTILQSYEGGAGLPYFGMTLAGIGDVNNDGLDDLLVGAPGHKDSAGHGGAAYLFAGQLNVAALAAPQFYAPSGAGPTQVITGDIFHDGWADFVSANPTTGKIAVQTNRQNGTLRAPKVYAAGKGANSVVASDLDNDGDFDVVVTAPRENKIVFFRNYTLIGKLHREGTVTVPGKPSAIIAADFNNDGFPDIATTNAGAASMTVILNNGNQIQRFHQRYASRRNYAVGAGATQVQAGDMNGDGFLDLVVANPALDEISVLLNMGNGRFFPHAVVAQPDGPIQIAVIDVNNDGQMEIACLCQSDDHVTIFSGEGGSSYQVTQVIDTGKGPRSLTTADYDLDGFVDLATANAGDDTISMLLNANGQFAHGVNFATHSGARSIISADIDGDGDQDVMTISATTGKMSIQLNRWLY